MLATKCICDNGLPFCVGSEKCKMKKTVVDPRFLIPDGVQIRVIQNNTVKEGEAVLLVNEKDYNRIKEKYRQCDNTDLTKQSEAANGSTESHSSGD